MKLFNLDFLFKPLLLAMTPKYWVGAAIGAVGSIAGGLLSDGETKEADKGPMIHMAKAGIYGKNPFRKDKKGYEQIGEEMLAPWIAGGLAGFNQFVTETLDPSKYKESPGYEWLREQALASVDTEMIAKGRYGGPRLEALQDRAGNFATTDYRNRLNDLSRLTQVGQWGTGQQLGEYRNNMNSMLSAFSPGQMYQDNSGTAMGQGVDNAFGNIGQAYYNQAQRGRNLEDSFAMIDRIGRTSQ